MDRPQAEQLLQTATGIPNATFRTGQWEAIDTVVNRRHKLMVVERTGWGKSIVYFISTRILRNQERGPTIVISPLLALMRNQITAAERLGLTAGTINSTNPECWRAVIAGIHANEIDLLLVSPERLSNDEFIQDVLIPIAENVGLLVIDEAHCISDWGHDFRPDYRRIVNILQHMPDNMPVLGTTATANNRVVNDVREQLGGFSIQRGPLMRESLHLQTMRLADQAERLAWLIDNIPAMPGTGIIYTLTKRDASQVAEWLQMNGIEARAYFSNVEHEDFQDSNTYRQYLEQALLENQIKALIATTALGMGYDKPDLGFVIHYQAPGSIVAYYQQVGRAGRAIDRAYGILLSGREDDEIHEYFRLTAFPNDAHVKQILGVLEDFDELSILQLQEHINLTKGQIEKVLKILSVENPAPVIKDGSKWRRTHIDFQIDHERIQRLNRQKEIEWREVQDYIDHNGCLMTFLNRALDDHTDQDCGKCANCVGRQIPPIQSLHANITEASRYLKKSEMPLVLKRQVARDAFPIYSFSGNLSENLRGEEGRILSRWGDAGWGQLVSDNKHAGHFDDELVDAVVEMIVERWAPEPLPEWVTCVPSNNHRILVPDFAQRVANHLDIQFRPVIRKIEENSSQKLMQNRFYQCNNLDGVFCIDTITEAGSVLLIDDIVDSGWTLTVLSALLKQAGSGAVFPLALATTAGG
jgi:ATP-dependent DNA helicase RecQ